MEDFIKNILQFVSIKDDVEFAVKFMQLHQRVKNLLKTILKGVAMLVLFAKTRFVGCHLMLCRFYVASPSLIILVHHKLWAVIVSGIANKQVQRFVSIVNDVLLIKRLKAIMQLTGSLSNMIHHSKGHSF